MSGKQPTTSVVRAIWVRSYPLVAGLMLLNTVIFVLYLGNAPHDPNVAELALAALLADSTVGVPALLLLFRAIHSFDELFAVTRHSRLVMELEYLTLMLADALTVAGTCLAAAAYVRDDWITAGMAAIAAIVANFAVKLVILLLNYFVFPAVWHVRSSAVKRLGRPLDE